MTGRDSRHIVGIQEAVSLVDGMPADTPKRILIADDAASARDLIRSILRPIGYEVFEAKDGEEALARAIEHQPDLVILDLQMPKLDGSSVAASLREMEAFEDTPILGLSAWMSQMDPAALTAAGFSEWLAKPVSPSKLRAVVHALISAANV